MKHFTVQHNMGWTYHLSQWATYVLLSLLICLSDQNYLTDKE